MVPNVAPPSDPPSGPAASPPEGEPPAIRLTLEPYSGPRSARAVVAFAEATQPPARRRGRIQTVGFAVLVAGLVLALGSVLARLGPFAP